ncbi:MAG TPA: trimeric intracellular cation channel family protein [Ignavibacteriaceae bacterium]|nr:trimeric intracellular cation channel family protein [Ignavibacteriaceae bacterium]
MFHQSFSLIYLVDLAGVAVFSISGALSAGRKGLDLLGVLVISIVTAIGGGTLRDLLLNRHPIFWIADPDYLIIIIAAALFTIFYVRLRKPPGNALLIADALGLSFFVISGTQIAETAGMHPIIIIIMGTMTGVAGGVIRDILSAEVPLILRRDIYATAAILGSGIYLISQQLGAVKEIAFFAGFITIVVLRLLAIIKGLRLPVFKLPVEPK